MICVKSNKEIEKMQKAGAITAGALIAAGEAIRPGMTTYELDKVVHRYITSWCKAKLPWLRRISRLSLHFRQR